MPRRPTPSIRTLTLRELNRALLARQMLLERKKVGVVDAIERLGGLQGQWAPAPYVALWTRLEGFERDDLTTPIDGGEVIKATLMRATLHLVSAR
ncbi:MAG TPA: crosslink repair DNA glycosylase YcaQ family protein, partial [Candidatus Limnocylindria bacterium]|nr:crosslink repair DNA glycosylase YcaQ family protein [Candidatus Limnocylindria bacterium]